MDCFRKTTGCLLDTLRSLLLPFIIVFVTSLPNYIVIRLYPELLNFANQDPKTNDERYYLFYMMIFFGSLVAIILSDFAIGSFFAILFGLLLQLILFTIVLSDLTTSSNKSTAYNTLLVTGLTIGIIQTVIAAFFGEQFTKNLLYTTLDHYHIYLLGNYLAHLLAIALIPLRYPKDFYGACLSLLCYRLPLIISITCLAVTIVLVVIFYRVWNYDRRQINYQTTVYRMEQAVYIFFPFIIFWYFTFLMEQFWMEQSRHMETKYQEHQLELIHAAIYLLCIMISCCIRLGRNGLYRISLGGILIIISVPVSSIYGNFYVPRHRDSFAIDNLTDVYVCSVSSTSIMHEQSYFQIGGVVMYVPMHSCIGPFVIKQQTYLETALYHRVVIDGKDETFPIKAHYPQTGTSTCYVRPSYIYTALFADFIAIPDRNYQSVAKLALIRFFSFYEGYATKKALDAFIIITNSKIQLNVSMELFNIMEIPAGEYNVSFESWLEPGANGWKIFYYRAGGYYIHFINHPNVPNVDCIQANRLDLVFTVFARISGYKYVQWYQYFQYILLSLGKILILSSGLEIAFAIADNDMKCSIIGIFCAIYNFGKFYYFLTSDQLRSNFYQNISAIPVIMLVSIGTFYIIYYFIAYKLTDVILKVDQMDGNLVTVENTELDVE